MATPDAPTATPPDNWLDLVALTEVERRLSCLVTALVERTGGSDRERAAGAGLTSIAAALWFDALRADDRVVITPPARPAVRAVEHLLGRLDRPVAVPAGRAGPAGTIWAALARRAVPADSTGADSGAALGSGAGPRGGAGTGSGPGSGASAGADAGGPPGGREICVLELADLAGGDRWEAVLDPATATLGELTWIVPVRHPRPAALSPDRYERLFDAAGWQVVSLRHGRRREELFRHAGGQGLRARLEAADPAELAALSRAVSVDARRRIAGGGASGVGAARLLESLSDDELRAVAADVGGHDLPMLVDAFDEVETTRPTVIFAHVLDGWLPRSGTGLLDGPGPLGPERLASVAELLGIDAAEPWTPPREGGRAAALVARAAARLERKPIEPAEPPVLPADLDHVYRTPTSTRVALTDVLRELAERSVDVADALVMVPEGPSVAAASRLGELGTTWLRFGHPLLPVGPVSGAGAAAAAAAWATRLGAGGQSILAATVPGPARPDTGQLGAGPIAADAVPASDLPASDLPASDLPASDLPASDLPADQVPASAVPDTVAGATGWRPAFVQDLEWCLLEALNQLGRPDGRSAYLRVSARVVDPALAAVPLGPSREVRRRHVLGGAYRLRDGGPAAAVTLVGCGAVLPEVLRAADELAAGLDRPVSVVCVTSPDLLAAALAARRGLAAGDPWVLTEIFPADRRGPLVTVADGDAAALGFLAGIHGDPISCVGVRDPEPDLGNGVMAGGEAIGGGLMAGGGGIGGSVIGGRAVADGDPVGPLRSAGPADRHGSGGDAPVDLATIVGAALDLLEELGESG